MKYIIILQLSLAALLTILFNSCSKEGEYTLESTPPLDFRSYYNGLIVTFANATEGATNISWNFGDNTPDMSGDSVIHTFAATGNYVITMNGTLAGKSYTFHTVLRVDKPSVISLTDESFSDWDNVTYPDFQLGGQEHVIGGKVDYDANYIFCFVEYEITGGEGLDDIESAVMDFYMDVDNSLSTGFSSSIGAELLFEGNIPTGWFDYYKFSGAEQSDWSWEYFTMDNAIILGHYETDGDIVRQEFGISREAFGINKDAFGFRMDLYYSDWSVSIGSLAIDNETHIIMMMNKE
jgi:hypothetical protein